MANSIRQAGRPLVSPFPFRPSSIRFARLWSFKFDKTNRRTRTPVETVLGTVVVEISCSFQDGPVLVEFRLEQDLRIIVGASGVLNFPNKVQDSEGDAGAKLTQQFRLRAKLGMSVAIAIANPIVNEAGTPFVDILRAIVRLSVADGFVVRRRDRAALRCQIATFM